MILHRKQYNFANLLGKVLLFYFVSVVAINASILISTSPRRINFASQNGNETCSLHNFRCIYRWLLRHYFLFSFLSVRFVVVGLFAFGKLWPSVIMLNERIADSATHKMTDCCFLHFFFLMFFVNKIRLYDFNNRPLSQCIVQSFYIRSDTPHPLLICVLRGALMLQTNCA